MATKKKEKSVLDQLKKVEKIKKLQMLAEIMSDIKKLAKDVLIAKEETKQILEELGFDAKETKSVIDYINTLVKLTKRDKDEIRDRVREDFEETEEKVEEKIKKNPFQYHGLNAIVTSASNDYSFNTSGSDYKTATGDNIQMYTNTSSTDVELKGIAKALGV